MLTLIIKKFDFFSTTATSLPTTWTILSSMSISILGSRKSVFSIFRSGLRTSEENASISLRSFFIESSRLAQSAWRNLRRTHTSGLRASRKLASRRRLNWRKACAARLTTSLSGRRRGTFFTASRICSVWVSKRCDLN